MSLDLLKEFGCSNQDLLENPWNEKLADKSPHDKDDFGDFEFPNDQITPQSPDESIFPRKLFSEPDRHPINSRNPLNDGSFPAPEDEEWGDFTKDCSGFSGSQCGSEDDDCANSVKDSKNKLVKPSESAGAVMLATDLMQSDPKKIKPPSSTVSETRNLDLTSPPPVNVPPPSVLLSYITILFQSLAIDLKNILPSIESSAGFQAVPNQALVDKLSTRLAVVRATARIIAGRKLRWRRDNHLSQSVKIGSAHAGGGGGMKLTGVDKTENRREDREAEEAVRTWRQQLGNLRTITAFLNHFQPIYNFTLPEISETMPIRQAKSSDGALSAPLCCFLCGVKRDERIERIDSYVEDSFREWWIDHWGHVDCTIFWADQEKFLQQRR